MLFRIMWIVRGLLYKPFFGRFTMPSYIGQPTFIQNFQRIFIHKKVRIFPGARMEVIYPSASIHIESDVSIGQNFHIISGSELIIGQNTTISANVFITNIDHEFRQIERHILDQPLLIKETRIGENCFIGYGAVIQAGTILGKQCIVGANAVVRGNFPDFSVIAGVPARMIKRYDTENQTWGKTDAKGNFIDKI